MSIEDLPVGSRGIEYRIDASESGWNFVLKGSQMPGARYYVNGSPVSVTSAGIRMSGRKNHVLVVPWKLR